MESVYEVTVEQPDEDDVRIIDEGEMRRVLEIYFERQDIPFENITVNRH